MNDDFDTLPAKHPRTVASVARVSVPHQYQYHHCDSFFASLEKYSALSVVCPQEVLTAYIDSDSFYVGPC